MNKTDFFWTDATQAQERLTNSVVLYDDLPVYVAEVTAGQDGIPRGYIEDCGVPRGTKQERKKLNSPKFKRFRELPKLGWTNLSVDGAVGQCVYTSRSVRRGSRTHGLSSNNFSLKQYRPDGRFREAGSAAFEIVIRDPGFVATHRGEYPTLVDCLGIVREGSVVAFSRTFAVLREAGFTFLLRETEKVGIFSGTDTLLLSPNFFYLREEIFGTAGFNINNLREL